MIKKLYKYCSYFLRIIPYFYLFVPALVYSFFIRNQEKYKDLWLISERGDEARDNGYHLFKYIKDNYPDMNVYFVISNESPDIDKIKRYGNNINTNSFEHYLYFILADKVLSTHLHGAAPNGKACLPFLKLIPQKTHVFLKHGLTKDKFSFNDKHVDLLVCASKYEIECLKYSSENVKNAIQLLGFCRYDGLINKAPFQQNKIILIMPTFRKWLEDISRLSNSDELFQKDPYFIEWNALLNNKKLIEKIEKQNITIIFYPHYRIQKYIHNFSSYSNNVIIADNRSYDIQYLLTISSMLVTDFSSVFFDFAYMKKPLVYYQFDLEKYRKKHYKEGTFSYQNDGFGPVFDNEDDVVNYIINILNNNFSMESKFLKRLDGFFEYNDNENCSRVFNSILKL